MSSRRTERLVNLVICLLSTRQFLPASRIRQAVPGYETGDSARADEAFKRMFERDKAELRELGIPLETGHNSVLDAEDGYRIARRDYELPEIELEPDEAAAVGLAARLWQSAGLADATRGALLKLRAAGVDVDESATMAIEPRVNATEPAFTHCLDAVRARRPVGFTYRGALRQPPTQRTVEPWGVVSWHGRWYLVGHDRGRDAVRCFRLSRIVDEVELLGEPGEVLVPEGVDLVAAVASEAPRGQLTARVRVRKGAAAGLRRNFPVTESGSDRDGDFDVLEVAYSDPERLADRIAGYGTDAVALDPPEVRDAVVRRLGAMAGRSVVPR
ncbi:MAG TPA: WYL domain-containing protein [Mycobacteriales bacterium]|jgi:proteasome accessory factor B|nr:WYL domain-containing protein [Mycobacteriales bacterium]